jgi:hypothetical protein
VPITRQYDAAQVRRVREDDKLAATGKPVDEKRK